MKDVADYLASVIPADIRKKGTLTIRSSSGSLRYTFTNDARVIIQAMDFKMDVLVRLNETDLPLAVEVKGAGYGKYAADPSLGTIVLTGLTNSDMALTATLGDVPLAKDTPINDLGWFGANSQDDGIQIHYQCQRNDALQLVVTRPESDQPALKPITLSPVIRK